MGYVQSIRGKNGGYLLSKAPNKINLNDLIQNLGSIGYSVSENRQNGNGDHVIDLIWDELDKIVLNAMQKINFEDISNRKRAQDNALMFQI